MSEKVRESLRKFEKVRESLRKFDKVEERKLVISGSCEILIIVDVGSINNIY